MLLCKRVLKASFKIAIYLFWEQNIDFLGMCLYFSWSHKSYQEVLKLLYLHDFLQRKEIQVLLCWIVDVSEINEGRTKFNHINPLQLSHREIFITSLSVFLKKPDHIRRIKIHESRQRICVLFKYEEQRFCGYTPNDSIWYSS